MKSTTLFAAPHEIVAARLPGWKLSCDMSGGPDGCYLVEVNRWEGSVLVFRTVWIDAERIVWDVRVDEQGYVVDGKGFKS